MSENQFVEPKIENLLKCRHHAKVLYGALRARDIPFIEKYLSGDHSDKEILELVHMLQTTKPARDHISNWTSARSVLRERLSAEKIHDSIVKSVMNGLYRENEEDK